MPRYPYGKPRIPAEKRQQALAMAREGQSLKSISRVLGISQSALTTWPEVRTAAEMVRRQRRACGEIEPE